MDKQQQISDPGSKLPANSHRSEAQMTVSAGSIAAMQARYDALMEERNKLARQLSAVPRGTRDMAERTTKLEEQVASIRQARDLILSRNHELISEFARAEDKLSELTLEGEDARHARDTALKERDERFAECTELRR